MNKYFWCCILLVNSLIVISVRAQSAGMKVADYDGNSYKIITIGTQVWMAENLKTLHYSNGDPIELIKDDRLWSESTSGACCINGNNKKNLKHYGLLYNFFAVASDKKICPAGWHVPNAADWKRLESFLGGAGAAGGKMKNTGTKFWAEPNTKADNSSGFNGLPGGARNTDGTFEPAGEKGHWWTGTEFSVTSAWHRSLYNNTAFIDNIYGYKSDGYSVRCIMDK